MAFTEPVILKRIPNDASKRKLYWYDDYVATGGYASLRKALDMPAADIIKTVTDSGLRGRGGAGFSAGQKWSFIPKEKKGPHYLAVNYDESEPGTFKDRYITDYDPHILLEGIAIASIATQCDIAYIFIRGEYHRQIKVMERAVREAYDKGIFGQQGIFGSRLQARMLHPQGGRGVHLRRGDGPARSPRRQARLAAQQAAVPGHRRRVRQADGHQQRRDARLRPVHHRARPRLV